MCNYKTYCVHQDNNLTEKEETWREIWKQISGVKSYGLNFYLSKTETQFKKNNSYFSMYQTKILCLFFNEKSCDPLIKILINSMA